MPPRLSATAITAPPWRPPLRLVSSSRTRSSAVTLSRVAVTILASSKWANGGCVSAIARKRSSAEWSASVIAKVPRSAGGPAFGNNARDARSLYGKRHGLCRAFLSFSCCGHSGAPRSGGPGIHNPVSPCYSRSVIMDSGLPRCARPRNDSHGVGVTGLNAAAARYEYRAAATSSLADRSSSHPHR